MKIEKPELVAYILIATGLVLLVLTFIIAALMLMSVVGIATSQDLSKALGGILGPIAEAVIKIMFLGIMGWTGSIATMRGIQLYRESKPPAQSQQIRQSKTEEKPPEKT
jgi:thiol:disulfide interchange protein